MDVVRVILEREYFDAAHLLVPRRSGLEPHAPFNLLWPGGSIGFADPKAQIGYAYVTNRMGVVMSGDTRDVALRYALYSAMPAAD